MPLRPPALSPDQRLVLHSGTGFALGFGWLWFAALQGLWLPRFLWGSVWSGGGTTFFCAALTAGALAVGLGTGLLRGRTAEPERDFRLARPHAVHAASLILAALGLFVPWPEHGWGLFLPPVFLALAALLQGLFWLAALLCLPGRNAAAALAVGAITAAVLAALGALTASFAPQGTLSLLLCLSLAAASRQAVLLGRILRMPPPEARRPRGRPKLTGENETETLENSRENTRPWAGGPLFAGPVFFLLGLGKAGLAVVSVSPPAWGTALLTAFGAALAAYLAEYPAATPARDDSAAPPHAPRHEAGVNGFRLSPRVLLCAAFSLQGAFLLLIPAFFPIPLWFCEGLICAALFVSLAQTPPSKALSRAGVVLALALLAGNLGEGAATLLAAYFTGETPARLAGTAALAGALALACWEWRGIAARKEQARQAAPEETEPAPELESPLTQLTERERDIAELVRQGLSNKEIANKLAVQEATVRFHLRNIYQKTGLTERGQLASPRDTDG